MAKSTTKTTTKSPRRPRTPGGAVPVNISTNPDFTLDFDPPTVGIHLHADWVDWSLVGDGKIDWVRSKKNHPKPFPKDHKYSGDGKHVVSDIVVDGTCVNQKFPYEARVTVNHKKYYGDPNVEVMPPTVGPGPHVSKPKTGS
jgi:hypothetical protein